MNVALKQWMGQGIGTLEIIGKGHRERKQDFLFVNVWEIKFRIIDIPDMVL
jgi:hypothetical protein